METFAVEEVAASLVREFLSKKGLKKTSTAMDEELPRTALSINNRTELRNVLHLQSLYKQNKAKENPLKTILEIMTSYFLEHTIGAKGVKERPSIPPNRTPIGRQVLSTENSAPIYCLRDGANSPSPLPEKDETYSFAIHETTTRPASLPRQRLHKSSEKNTTDPAEGEKKLVNHCGGWQTPEQHSWTKTAMRQNLQARAGGLIATEMMAGPKDSSPEDSLKIKPLKWPSGMGSPASLAEQEGRKSGLTTPEEDSRRTVGISRRSANLCSSHSSLDLSQDGSPKTLFNPPTSTNNELATSPACGRGEPLAKRVPQKGQAGEKKPESSCSSEMNRKSSHLHISQWKMSAGSEKRMELSQKRELPFAACRKALASPPCKDRLPRDALELEDVEDEGLVEEAYKMPDHSALNMLQVASKPIDFSLARELKTLFFGSSLGCFSKEWKIQSFAFNDNPQLKYGIVQKKGGPCGVLAAVQASVLGHLIFGDGVKNSDTRCLQPSEAHRTKCLTLALADILWRAGGNKKAVVTLHTEAQQFMPAGKYKADGILEMLMLHTVTKYEDLVAFLQQNIRQFEVGPHGCILLTLSAVLSRSINQVRGDFDVSTNQLIGAHGYCTQELVNLLLTGHAVSNVFNDTMELDSGNGQVTLLKGIAGRSNIGLLSLFEQYNVCKVGCYLKTPKLPIWLVCSESHFSVLFCLTKDLLGDWRAERRFDLFYYDGLANQQEEIRLTVDTSRPYVEDKDDDLTPPLEHCIRTKWKGAVVSWNGTEPIL
uniref:Ubiquitin carboxyl-terminal hydrolase MINDY n=1 Tax=Pogona vitticeps TaxID=103695 RepID=A0ABM5GMP4_9SAUR